MKSKSYAGKMGLLLLAIAILVVMSGCGKQAASTEAATDQPSDQVQGAVNSAAPKNPVMSQKELELSMLFRGLLQMDNKGELIISKEQAVSMLPIITKSTEDGEITTDNQQKLIALLSPEQKKYIDEMNARLKQFSGNRNNANGAGGGNRPALTDEQLAEFQKNRKNPDKGQSTGTDSQGQGNGGFGGFGQNVEQQLLDLLDSKINN
jgi:hypothetical protein